MISNESSNKKALKSGVWYTIANFFSKSLVFLTTPLFTRLMTTGEIGNFSNFTSLLAIFSAIASLQLFSSIAVARFDYKDDMNSYIASNLVFGSLFALLIYAVFFIFRQQISAGIGINEVEFHLMFIYLLVYPALEMMQLKCRIEYKYRSSVIITISSVILSTLISVLMAFVMEDKLLGRILGYYVPLIVLNLILYIILLSRIKKFSFEYIKYALRLSLPMVIHILSSELLSSSDKVMITKMCGEDQNGLYSIAYTSAVVVSVLWTSMNTAWSPWLFEKINSGEEAIVRKASRFYVLFYCFVIFLYLLVAPEVLYIMGGEEYMQTVGILPPIIVSYIFLFVYSLYVGIEIYYKKQRLIAISTFIAAGLNILLNYLLIPVYGYGVAAYTTLIGYIVMFVLHFIFVKILKKSYIYDSLFNLIIVSAFLVLMVGTILLYKLPMVRYICIGIITLFIIGVIIWLRREIFSLIRDKSFDMMKEKFQKVFKKK